MQEVRKQGEFWGVFDSKGTPIGDGCRLCLETLVEGFPRSTHAEMSSAVHATSPTAEQKELKKEWLAARRMKKESGILKYRFMPPSQVETARTRTRTVYTEVGFLTKTEMRDLLAEKPSGNWAKKLGLHEVQVPLEDRNEQVAGYCVSLKGLPVNVAIWIRKIRTSYTFEVRHEELRLERSNQIREQQGMQLFDHYAENQASTGLDVCKSANRHRLPLLSDLVDKAAQLAKDEAKDR